MGQALLSMFRDLWWDFPAETSLVPRGISLGYPKNHMNQQRRPLLCSVQLPMGKTCKNECGSLQHHFLGIPHGNSQELPFPELPKAAGKSSAKAERGCGWNSNAQLHLDAAQTS